MNHFSTRAVMMAHALLATCREGIRQSDYYNPTLRSPHHNYLSARRPEGSFYGTDDRVTNRNAAHSLVAVAVEDLDDRLSRCGEDQSRRQRERIGSAVRWMEVEARVALRGAQNSLQPELRVEQICRVGANACQRPVEVDGYTHHLCKAVRHEVPDVSGLRDS